MLAALETKGVADWRFSNRIRLAFRIAWQDWDEVVDLCRLLSRVPRRRKRLPGAVVDVPKSVFVVREFVAFFAAINRTHCAEQTIVARLRDHIGLTEEEIRGIKVEDFYPAKCWIRVLTLDGGGVKFGMALGSIIAYGMLRGGSTSVRQPRRR